MFDHCFRCGATVNYEVNEHSLCRCCGKPAFPTLLDRLVEGDAGWNEPGRLQGTLEGEIVVKPGFVLWDPKALESGHLF